MEGKRELTFSALSSNNAGREEWRTGLHSIQLSICAFAWVSGESLWRMLRVWSIMQLSLGASGGVNTRESAPSIKRQLRKDAEVLKTECWLVTAYYEN